MFKKGRGRQKKSEKWIIKNPRNESWSLFQVLGGGGGGTCQQTILSKKNPSWQQHRQEGYISSVLWFKGHHEDLIKAHFGIPHWSSCKGMINLRS